MSRVHFAAGPFAKYADGHPPEKETEAERRRYRKGLTLLRCRDLSVWESGARCPSSGLNINWFERFQPRPLEQNECAMIPLPALKDWRTGIPSIWESFDSHESEKEAGLGTGRLEVLTMSSGPPHLCRDSVMSIDDPKAPVAQKVQELELQKELRALEFEEPDIEALWSRASESWASNDCSQTEHMVGENVVAAADWHPSRCFSAVLGVLRWGQLSWTASKKSDTAMDSRKSTARYMCCTRYVSCACCTKLEGVSGGKEQWMLYIESNTSATVHCPLWPLLLVRQVLPLAQGGQSL